MCQHSLIYEETWQFPPREALTFLNTAFRVNKEFRPIPLFLLLAIIACGAPESYLSLAIAAFGALEFIAPKHYFRLGKTDKITADFGPPPPTPENLQTLAFLSVFLG